MDPNGRKKWIEYYERTGDAGLTCQRCGISRPTLRKWWKRYLEKREEGLIEQSRRPHHSPGRKINEDLKNLVMRLRKTRNIGARRLQCELLLNDDIRLSLGTIHKILTISEAKPLLKQGKKSHWRRYEASLPGERIQMDTCKIGPGMYQYTAIDDCSRYRVMRLYKRRTAANTLLFLEDLLEEMPFPIQRIQTDRGLEFFAESVQTKLMELHIKFRPNRPRSPHLNGKVERSQKTDRIEFYALNDLPYEQLAEELECWQTTYNYRRPHGSLGGKTPMQRVCELYEKTPYSDEVFYAYDSSKEVLRVADYKIDLRMQKLKRCL